jgi:hypothetical protein
MKQLPNGNLRFQPQDFNINQQIVYFLVHFKFSTSIEVWLGNYLKFTNLPNDVYFLLTMSAFSCALYNINTGRHFGEK